MPVIAAERIDGPRDLAPFRRLLADTAISVALPAERADPFTVALSDMATNAPPRQEHLLVVALGGRQPGNRNDTMVYRFSGISGKVGRLGR